MNTQETQVTQPTQVDTLTAQADLFNRALSLGYTTDGAARLADCFTNWDDVSDPCPTHPNHSTAIRDGYAVDSCEACEVITLSTNAGYTLESFQAAQQRRHAEQMVEFNRAEPTGIDTLRELLTLDTPVPTRKAPKLRAVHAADLGTGDDKTTACGSAQVRSRVTLVPESVTCKRCKGTQRFQRWATSTAWRLKEAEFARAGLRTEMVVREIDGAGRFGVVARIKSGGIEIYFWTPDQAGKTYRQFATVAAFDQACEIVILDKVIRVGDRLVSNLGGEAVVLGVTSTSVRYRRMGIGTPVNLTASEFAAELARGLVAVIPALRVRVSQVIRWTARPHQYGIVTALNSVNPSQATMSVHSLGSDQYGVTLHLDKLAQQIMRGEATISELPVGSWR